MAVCLWSLKGRLPRPLSEILAPEQFLQWGLAMTNHPSPRGAQRRGGLPVVFERQIATPPFCNFSTGKILAAGARNDEAFVTARSAAMWRSACGL